MHNETHAYIQEYTRGAWLFFGFFVLLCISQIFSLISPNIFLLFALSCAFFIDDIWTFLLCIGGGLLVVEYVPYLSYEIVALAVMSVLTFLILKVFILRRGFILFIVCILLLQTLFWALFYQAGIVSLSFVMEFLYNIVFGGMFFVYSIWLKKKFS